MFYGLYEGWPLFVTVDADDDDVAVSIEFGKRKVRLERNIDASLAIGGAEGVTGDGRNKP